MAQFVVEASELVRQANDDLLTLERDPENAASLNSAFRAFHTLKGSVGLFDLPEMQRVLHAAEGLLENARRNTTPIEATLIDTLLGVLTWTENCVEDLRSSAILSAASIAAAGSTLHPMEVGLETSSRVRPEAASGDTPIWAEDLLGEALDKLTPGRNPLCWRYRPHRECYFSGDDPLALVATIPDLVHLKIGPAEPWPAPDAYDPFICNLLIEGLTYSPRSEVEAVFRLLPDQVEFVQIESGPTPTPDSTPPPITPTAYANQSRTLRVDASRIDALVDMVGELVTAKNGLSHLATLAKTGSDGDHLSRRILDAQQDLERLTTHLYAAVMKTRMVAIGETFRRFPRLVREIAAQLGKPVDLIIEGETVEADRAVVDDLFEPLLHLVRNGLDHGIEEPAIRPETGKLARGSLTLQARQFNGSLVVEFSDDGKGIDPERIRDAAVSSGVIGRRLADGLPDAAVLDLMFMPGFSTSSTVSELSGRGVGLDAVKAAVQKLGGRVEVFSELGKGTRFQLTLPVTLALSQLVVVEVANERYGLPLEAVVESVRVPAGAILPIHAGEAFVLRGKTLPLLRLAPLLELPEAKVPDGEIKIVVTRIDDERVGIAVDSIAERTQTITRPTAGLLSTVRGVAGTALMGDGSVLMVLDLEALIR